MSNLKILLTKKEQEILNQKLSDRTLSAYIIDRYRIIHSIVLGFNPTDISRILGCERQTIYNWSKSFSKSGFSEFEKVRGSQHPDRRDEEEEMNKEEELKKAIRKYEILTKRLRTLTNQINKTYQKRELARKEYESITGKDIGTRFEPK